MNVIMDGMLIAGAIFAGLYCMILSRRVNALKSLDSGLGGSIVTLTRQIELARTTLEEARNATGEKHRELTDLVARSETAAAQLRLLLVATKEQPQRARPARAAQAYARAPEPQVDPAPRREAAPAPQPAAQTVAQAEAEPEEVVSPSTISVRRRDSLGPRLVTLPAIASLTWPPESEPLPEYVPKPRRPPAPEHRKRSPIEDVVPQTEEDLMAALGAIAAGGDR